ncbi:hypothetical protein JZU48_04680, partial [bacterium]|nr:hypothetical protein [bacterium]
LILWSGLAAAAGGDIANPPEDPLPPLAPALSQAPNGPEYDAPTAQQLLEACPSKDFVECFRNWKPPPPPPEEPKSTAAEEKAKKDEAKRQAAAQPPPPPGAPREPAVGGP